MNFTITMGIEFSVFIALIKRGLTKFRAMYCTKQLPVEALVCFMLSYDSVTKFFKRAEARSCIILFNRCLRNLQNDQSFECYT